MLDRTEAYTAEDGRKGSFSATLKIVEVAVVPVEQEKVAAE